MISFKLLAIVLRNINIFHLYKMRLYNTTKTKLNFQSITNQQDEIVHRKKKLQNETVKCLILKTRIQILLNTNVHNTY